MSESVIIERELTASQLSRLFVSLGMVYESGLSVTEGLSILLGVANNQTEKRLLTALSEAMLNGSRLSDAFEKTGGLPQYALSLLKVAEYTGQMAETCQALADFYDKRDRLSQAIRSSLFYPLAMTLMVILVVVLLLTQAMPIFDQVFAQFGFEMSGLARTFLSIGIWMRSAALWLSLVVLAIGILILILRVLPVGKHFFHWLFEHSPLTSDLSFRLSAQRLMLGMAAMLKSGMAPQSAIELAQDLVDDSRVKSRLTDLSKQLSTGISFQKALFDSGLLPKESHLLVAIGFNTGSNVQAFERIGEDLMLSTERRMVSLVSAIEPGLVAVMTILVGVILLSVLLPLLGVLTSI